MDSSVDISPTELKPQAHGGYGEGEAASALADKKIEIRTTPSKEHNYVQELVSKNHVVVFSKSHCPHCTSSKSLLSDRGIQYKIVELDEIQEGGQVQNVLGSITNARTVPRIFIDGQCVGGNSELQNLDKSGKLEQLLQKEQEGLQVD